MIHITIWLWICTHVDFGWGQFWNVRAQILWQQYLVTGDSHADIPRYLGTTSFQLGWYQWRIMTNFLKVIISNVQITWCTCGVLSNYMESTHASGPCCSAMMLLPQAWSKHRMAIAVLVYESKGGLCLARHWVRLAPIRFKSIGFAVQFKFKFESQIWKPWLLFRYFQIVKPPVGCRASNLLVSLHIRYPDPCINGMIALSEQEGPCWLMISRIVIWEAARLSECSSSSSSFPRPASCCASMPFARYGHVKVKSALQILTLSAPLPIDIEGAITLLQ